MPIMAFFQSPVASVATKYKSRPLRLFVWPGIIRTMLQQESVMFGAPHCGHRKRLLRDKQRGPKHGECRHACEHSQDRLEHQQSCDTRRRKTTAQVRANALFLKLGVKPPAGLMSAIETDKRYSSNQPYGVVSLEIDRSKIDTLTIAIKAAATA